LRWFKLLAPWVFLAGNFCFPVSAVIVGELYSKGNEIGDVDWNGDSAPAQAVKAIMLLQILYVPLATVLLRGHRMIAIVGGILVLALSLEAYIGAYVQVTHIYI
jgi:hypothetical protein